MRRLSVVLVASAAFVLMVADGASAQQIRKAERLRGGNENPPVVSDGLGNFRAELFPDHIEFRLRYGVAGVDSDVTQAHLHIANPSNNGAIVVFLCSNVGNTPDGVTERECPLSPGEVTGEIVAADVLEVTDGVPPVTVIEAGDLDGLIQLIKQSAVYANVHSDDHPAGEVRGQMSPRIR